MPAKYPWSSGMSEVDASDHGYRNNALRLFVSFLLASPAASQPQSSIIPNRIDRSVGTRSVHSRDHDGHSSNRAANVLFATMRPMRLAAFLGAASLLCGVPTKAKEVNPTLQIGDDASNDALYLAPLLLLGPLAPVMSQIRKLEANSSYVSPETKIAQDAVDSAYSLVTPMDEN